MQPFHFSLIHLHQLLCQSHWFNPYSSLLLPCSFFLLCKLGFQWRLVLNISVEASKKIHFFSGLNIQLTISDWYAYWPLLEALKWVSKSQTWMDSILLSTKLERSIRKFHKLLLSSFMIWAKSRTETGL